jgi:methylated-DNA-[protein]-cysteine S-methyltransferase
MKQIEQVLRRAGKQRYAAESKRLAGGFWEPAAGAGLLDVAFTTIDDAPVGPIMLAATRRGLLKVSFAKALDPENFIAELSAAVSPRILEAPAYFDGIRRELDEYFAGRRTRFDLPLDWSLTGGFRRRVLKRTARIPYGRVATYGEVAADAGNPRASRAAGNALGANPIPIVVPCHRVVRTGGDIGNYGGGPEVKKFLLELEGAI